MSIRRTAALTLAGLTAAATLTVAGPARADDTVPPTDSGDCTTSLATLTAAYDAQSAELAEARANLSNVGGIMLRQQGELHRRFAFITSQTAALQQEQTRAARTEQRLRDRIAHLRYRLHHARR